MFQVLSLLGLLPFDCQRFSVRYLLDYLVIFGFLGIIYAFGNFHKEIKGKLLEELVQEAVEVFTGLHSRAREQDATARRGKRKAQETEVTRCKNMYVLFSSGLTFPSGRVYIWIEEENPGGPPADQYTAPPRGGTLGGGEVACKLHSAARGLEYLHEKVQPPIVHRDVRSSNVLLFDDFVAKIADFSLTNQSSDTAARLHSTRVLGTFGYHAPKYAMTGQITHKSDVYSFGVVLLELLTGRKPVDHTMPKGQQSLVTWATPRLSEDKVKQCVDPKLENDYPPKAIAKGRKSALPRILSST
ncbi:hypothetical protein POM88_047185 [Heracleum sosnowskyi]|uniref:Protein kinase domain-containing protein n=1 Tax=Heracleum sosnowskyi TaxID=360622 RepID=A0AAD8HA13_9APIA|nr:hypothetical protein POM88_047185 [Heracleum sosnowskyi]